MIVIVITNSLLKQINERNHEELDKLISAEPKSLTRLHLLIKSGYVRHENDDFEITLRGKELIASLQISHQQSYNGDKLTKPEIVQHLALWGCDDTRTYKAVTHLLQRIGCQVQDQ